jgi:hypothetical protein
MDQPTVMMNRTSLWVIQAKIVVRNRTPEASFITKMLQRGTWSQLVCEGHDVNFALVTLVDLVQLQAMFSR